MHCWGVAIVIMVLCGVAVFPAQAQQVDERSLTFSKGTFVLSEKYF